MKRNLILLTTIVTVPVFLIVFIATGVAVFYMVFDNAGNSETENSAVIRIRTITDLDLASADSVTDEPVLLVESVQTEETAEQAAVVVPTFIEANEVAEEITSNPPLLVENEESEVVVAELAPVPSEVVETVPAVVEPAPSISQEEESPVSADEPPVIEIPAEPAKIEQRPLPESIAEPVPAQEEVPQVESSFVPGSSFFDQLLDQVQ